MRVMIAGALVLTVTFSTMCIVAAQQQAPPVPSVTPLSTDSEVIKALDGQTRKVTMYNPSMSATGTWDWKNKRIHIISGSAKFDKPWNVKKGKYCVQGEPCRTLYIDGGKIYEVNPDGHVHAVSE